MLAACLEMGDGPLAGLLARAVYVVGKDGNVKYAQIVPEITMQTADQKTAFSAKRRPRRWIPKVPTE